MNRKLGTVLGAAAFVVAVIVVALTIRPGLPPAAAIRGARIAAVINLTGPAAQFDAVKQRTLELAEVRARQLFPKAAVVLRVFDAGEGPEGTAIAVKRAKEWGAQYFLSGTSPTALAIAAQLRGQSPAVVQMANAANPEFGPPHLGEYRLWPDWNEEARLVSDILKAQQFQRVLVIHSADPYSESLKGALERELSAGAKFSAAFQQYDPASSPDFRPALTRAQADNASAVVVFGLPPGIRALISQMQQVRWTGAVIGGVNINLTVPDFAASGLPGPLWSIQTPTMRKDLPPTGEPRAFRNAYVEKYGEIPPFHAIYLADAIYLIAEAQSRSPDSNPVDAVRKVRDFESASGSVHVSDDGILGYSLKSAKTFPKE